jgi:hypothetical protein
MRASDSAKALSLPTVVVWLVVLGLPYFVFPWLLIRLYLGQDVRRTLEAGHPRPC